MANIGLETPGRLHRLQNHELTMSRSHLSRRRYGVQRVQQAYPQTESLARRVGVRVPQPAVAVSPFAIHQSVGWSGHVVRLVHLTICRDRGGRGRDHFLFAVFEPAERSDVGARMQSRARAGKRRAIQCNASSVLPSFRPSLSQSLPTP